MKKISFILKNILVAGGTGMVGQMLVPKLIELGLMYIFLHLITNHYVQKALKDFIVKTYYI